MQNTTILKISCLMVSLYLFSNTVITPALTEISKHFSIDAKIAQYISVLYILGLGLSQMFYGPLSDIHGRKKIVLLGSILFITANTLSLFASTLNEIFCIRFIQGLGAGCYSVIAKASMRDVYKDSTYINATALVMIVSVLTQMTAPIFGGAIISLFTWHEIWVAILIYSLVVFSVIIIYMPETSVTVRSKVSHLRTIMDNYKDLLSNMMFLLYMVLSSLTLSCITIYYCASPFIFLELYDLSDLNFGLTFLLTDSTFLIGSLCVYLLKNTINSERRILSGLFIMVIASTIITVILLVGIKSLVATLLCTAAFNLGTGFVFPICTAKAITSHPANQGTSGAVIGAFQMILGAIIATIFSFISNGNQQIVFVSLLVISLVSMGILLIRDN